MSGQGKGRGRKTMEEGQRVWLGELGGHLNSMAGVWPCGSCTRSCRAIAAVLFRATQVSSGQQPEQIHRNIYDTHVCILGMPDR